MSCTTNFRPKPQQQQQKHPHHSPHTNLNTTPSTGLEGHLSARDRNMPSPRTSPAMRPTSPLSPRQTAHFDSLQAPPPQRAMHSRTNSSNQRRPPTSSLKLPSLPRFHPANFPSANSSTQNTPDGRESPQPPVSPRAHQRLYSDAQKQLYFNQREILSAAIRSPSSTGKPTSPRLQPLGSPGPVTPLELEGEEGYLLAGARSSAASGPTAPEELVERLIREETRRHRISTSASTSGR